MTIPDLPNLMDTLSTAWPFLVTGGAVLAIALTLVAVLTRRPSRRSARQKMSLENRLTFLVAIIIAGVCAQGMGLFFYRELQFPLGLVIVFGGVLELTAFVCALRARRNVMDPDIGKAGIDGIAVWVVTALSGTFSAMEADKFEVAMFRLVMPLLAAWLWERGMSIERRKVRGGSTIHWRITPERILVGLRIAEPSGRTASEVDAHRRLTRVAKAAAKVRVLRRTNAAGWRIEFAERRLDRAMRSAVTHAGLAADPARQQALIAQLGSMYNADTLADLTPDAPWKEFANPVQRTWFEVQGLEFTPTRFAPRPTVQVHAEVQEPKHAEVHAGSVEVREPAQPAVEPHREPAPVNQEVREPSTATARKPEPPKANRSPRTAPRGGRTSNLPDRAAKKDAEVQQVLNLIKERGYDAVTLNVVRTELGFTKTTAYNRLTAARELVNQDANQKAVNQ